MKKELEFGYNVYQLKSKNRLKKKVTLSFKARPTNYKELKESRTRYTEYSGKFTFYNISEESNKWWNESNILRTKDVYAIIEKMVETKGIKKKHLNRFLLRKYVFLQCFSEAFKDCLEQLPLVIEKRYKTQLDAYIESAPYLHYEAYVGSDELLKLLTPDNYKKCLIRIKFGINYLLNNTAKAQLNEELKKMIKRLKATTIYERCRKYAFGILDSAEKRNKEKKEYDKSLDKLIDSFRNLKMPNEDRFDLFVDLRNKHNQYFKTQIEGKKGYALTRILQINDNHITSDRDLENSIRSGNMSNAIDILFEKKALRMHHIYNILMSSFGEIGELKENIIELKGVISKQTEEIKQLKNVTSKHGGEFTELKNRVKKLKELLAKRDEKIKTLDSQYIDLSKRYCDGIEERENLKNEVDTLRLNLARLKAINKELTEKVEELKEESHSLIERIKELEKENRELKKQNTEISRKNQELTERVIKLEAENKKLKKDIKENYVPKKEHNKVLIRLKKMEERLKRLENENRKLKKS